MVSIENTVNESEEIYDNTRYNLKYINVDESDKTDYVMKVLSELDRIVGHIVSGETFKKVSISYSLSNRSDARSEKISGKIIM